MVDADKELIELRREIIEARNQAIKTDNQVKNLSIEIKSFQKRFDSLERRTRIASIGVHIIVATAIIIAAFVIHSALVGSLKSELESTQKATTDIKIKAEKALAHAKQREKEIEKERNLRKKAAASAVKLVTLLDNKQEKEAVDLLEDIELSQLTTLEAKLLERRVSDLRDQAAESAYRLARTAQNKSNHSSAIMGYQRSLKLAPDGRFASAARYYLAAALWSQKRYQEAEPVLRTIIKSNDDAAVIDEARYLLGVTLAALNRREEARKVLTEVQRKGGKFGNYAKGQLASLDKTELSQKTKAKDAQAKPATKLKPKPSAKPANKTNND
ncbi:MAG: tetratricopeptide repeat protein [Deltaproteobacteria bacterium]|nr:tetratricopeptide repeat protein [Deltaproteobacteria bacterium]